MTVFTRIVPGKVENGGIGDRSIPEYTTSPIAAPLHLPVLHVVTPKGPLASQKGTTWIAPGNFTAIFGDIFDASSPLYNPTSLLVQALAAGAQGTIGVRRLSANEEVARVAISAFVQKKTIPDYQRDTAGRYKYDANGDKIPVAGKTFQGLSVELKVDPMAKTTEPGKLAFRTIAAAGGEPETIVYPLFEALAGVGDEYNRSGLQLGVRSESSNWRSVSEFVRNTGIYPFDLREFVTTKSGDRSYSKTTSGRDSSKFTLFQVEANKVVYSLHRGFGAFTGTAENRPNVAVPAPFNDIITYDENIDTLCQLMYSVEKDNNTSLVEVGDEFNWYKQMNPFTCVNHSGAPYYAVVTKGAVQWDLSGAVMATGGIHPLYGKDGKLPAYVTKPPVNDPFGLLAGLAVPVTAAQGWQVNNNLMKADLTTYVNGDAMKDVTRNRQSLFWDVGYDQEVKELAAQMLGQRKDIMVVLCGTVWTPGAQNPLEEVYSRAALLTNTLRMTPESEKWGTPACRAAVNIIEAKVINELNAWYFSGNIDLAYAFARFAGRNNGLISAPLSPDSGDNRILTLMHQPNITFENDDVSADNFSGGNITLKPYDWNTQVYRPGLPTVYINVDSVLKDLVTPFLCVCVEKISDDQWKLVCGDTTKTAANYAAEMKDNIERFTRAAVGGMVSSITARTFYQEGQPGARAKLSVEVSAYFNKAKYMMEFDLFAYNQQDLAA